MQYKILYITFTDFGDLSSGSAVRSFRMYNAFKNLGYDVKLLEGQQNKRKTRREKVNEIFHWLDNNTPDLCYVEPPVGPFFNLIDLKLLKRLHKMGVPIGLFYRDFYWKFPKWAWKDTPIWKKVILIAMHKRDLRIFKECCDVVFFPSEECIEILEYVHFRKCKVLPPGCSKPNSHVKLGANEIFYAGGVRQEDGVDDLLIALDNVNKKGLNIKLNLVTKKKELKYLNNQELLNRDWLSIFEASGDELTPIYERSDLGILSRRRHFYMDIAIPVKVLEYMSKGLPVISTDCPAIARFIRENNSGIVCNEGSQSIEDAINEYYTNRQLYLNLIENVEKAALKNTWEKRVEQMITDLMNI